jgi:hypothetical protein
MFKSLAGRTAVITGASQRDRARDCSPFRGSRLFCSGSRPQYSRKRERRKRDHGSGGQSERL